MYLYAVHCVSSLIQFDCVCQQNVLKQGPCWVELLMLKQSPDAMVLLLCAVAAKCNTYRHARFHILPPAIAYGAPAPSLLDVLCTC